jgi:RNA polymerase sigma factor (sigma-70 family)
MTSGSTQNAMRVSDQPVSEADAQLEEYWQRLVVYFTVRGCAPTAEDLASEVITRVLSRMNAGETVRDVGAYVYGVARHVRSEYLRDKFERHEEILVDPPAIVSTEHELDASWLTECLEALFPESRQLLLEFYAEGKNKRNRAALAARLNIGTNALYIRASRLRRKVKDCVMRRAAAGRDG